MSESKPTRTELARMIDHTLLKPDATAAQVEQLCREALEHHFAAVCVNPWYVPLCARLLTGSDVAVCTVAGFPLGATLTAAKAFEARAAIDAGATEVDMVINVGALKSGALDEVEQDIAEVARACHAGGAILKVIIEAALLTDDEKVTACELSRAAGADFVKTSTGFGPGGATAEDVALMRRVVGPTMGVKAAGGISTLADARRMVAAGANRIGASRSVQIVSEPEPRYVVLLGPPASGKGTQAATLHDEICLPHVASGDLFREHLKHETELGRQAKEYMDRGELVPDDVTIAMVMERLGRDDCARGALLDGFPRTIAQAETLDRELSARGRAIETVLYVAVPDEVLVERVSGRRLCPECGRSYHVRFNPPRQPGVCDDDGATLYQRDDDQPETVRKRLQVYHDQTSPLIDYYRQRGVLVEVDGDRPIEAVTDALREAITDITAITNCTY